MTLAELKLKAASDPNDPYRLRALTPAIAASIVADHEAVLKAAVAAAELFEPFDVVGHVEHRSGIGDVRREFARRLERSVP